MAVGQWVKPWHPNTKVAGEWCSSLHNMMMTGLNSS